MRFIFRLASLAALLVAVVAGTIDAIQSVAASRVVMTPLGEAWQSVSATSLAGLRALAAYYLHPSIDRVAISWVLQQPAFAVFLVLALLLWMIGYKKPKPGGRFAV